MTHPKAGMDGWKKGTVAEVFDESLGTELFNLLWGQERTAMPTVVDYAYEQIWKRVILIGGAEEQRLSDVTLAEQLGVTRSGRAGACRSPARFLDSYIHCPGYP
jgi:hypothetical protein